MTQRILILGGTTESRLLAERLAGLGSAVTLSLAGRTVNPAPQPVPVRSGGFGGAAGLARYLVEEGVDLLIDATHPYAAQISANAAAAAAATGVRALALVRPPWRKAAGDRWTEVAGVEDAVAALGNAPRRVFLTLGRNEVQAFNAAPQHRYLLRSVDPIEPRLAVADAVYLTRRGPFEQADECRLLETHGIDAVVAKNSGGSATYGKIAAARALGIEVILLRRPPPSGLPAVADLDEAVAAVAHRPAPA
ncbi:MAG: cobalt-precorrin-6A reductase [Mesorhizobium sp.]|jgi:precorrin-6A/cobalt-precorrin-6A reductase